MFSIENGLKHVLDWKKNGVNPQKHTASVVEKKFKFNIWIEFAKNEKKNSIATKFRHLVLSVVF